MSVGTSTDGKREAKLYRKCMEADGWTAEAPRWSPSAPCAKQCSLPPQGAQAVL